MEKHKCKLCSRIFNNGRALGGHMKSHLVASQTTRKKLAEFQTESASSSSSSEKSPVYGLRENPKRSVRVADPDFSFANSESGSLSAVVVVHDDGETENEPENPVQKRVKRARKKSGLEIQRLGSKKKKGQNSPESMTTESPEPVSSVSDTSPEQDLAMCLIMLSRDVWKSKVEAKEVEQLKKTVVVLEEAEKLNREIQDKKCKKVFPSHHALNRRGKRCFNIGNATSTAIAIVDEAKDMIFGCPFCSKTFVSGQALGGHKRIHLYNTNTSTREPKQCLIDLNLPPPPDDEVSSVISEV